MVDVPLLNFLLELCGRCASRDGLGETDEYAYSDRFENGPAVMLNSSGRARYCSVVRIVEGKQVK